MKKILLFLLGLILVAMSGGAIYLAGAIYDATSSQRIIPYFFQPNNLSEHRPGTPETPTEMGEMEFLDLLVRKYVTEYFYVAPDVENIARRMGANGALGRMSSRSVFDSWLNGEARTIQEMAGNKVFRTVRVIDRVTRPVNSTYWIVNYELTTWNGPNNFGVIPQKSRGTMFMDITYEPRMLSNIDIRALHDYLENGGDPCTVFHFRVNEIIQG